MVTGAFTTFGVCAPVATFLVAGLARLAFALPRIARALGFLAAVLAADMREALLAAFRTGFFARAPAERLVREVVLLFREDAFAMLSHSLCWIRRASRNGSIGSSIKLTRDAMEV